MTESTNILPPNAKLCAGLWNGNDCERRNTCARHTEIETTPGAVMVYASVCNSLGNLSSYVEAVRLTPMHRVRDEVGEVDA